MAASGWTRRRLVHKYRRDSYLPNWLRRELLRQPGVLSPADERFDQDLAIFECRLPAEPVLAPPKEELPPDLTEARLLALPDRVGLPREAAIDKRNNNKRKTWEAATYGREGTGKCVLFRGGMTGCW